MKVFLAALSISIVIISCSKKEELSTCQKFDARDLEMNQLYNQVTLDYADSLKFLKRLKRSQVYWIQYRDAQIKALYPDDKERYGASYSECKCQLYLDFTERRIKELSIWIEGVPEKPDCPNSVKVKK